MFKQSQLRTPIVFHGRRRMTLPALSVTLALALAMACGAGVAGANNAQHRLSVTASGTASTPAVAPPRESLTARWWKTYASLRKTADPAARCDLGLDKVVFLGATTSDAAVSRSCTLSAGTSILVPLINAVCSGPGDGRTAAEWSACAKGLADDFIPLFLTINGVAVGNLSRLRVPSQPFGLSPVTDNIFGLPAIAAGAVSDGYWALIGPLARGTYDVSFSGSYPPGDFSTHVTYHLTVV
jgi:hypothetical protein